LPVGSQQEDPNRLETLVNKSVTCVFKSQKLIKSPLLELIDKRKGIKRRFPLAIFVGGLDECCNPSAQCEIIEIVADEQYLEGLTKTLLISMAQAWQYILHGS
jgi:hypothetical protein